MCRQTFWRPPPPYATGDHPGQAGGAVLRDGAVGVVHDRQAAVIGQAVGEVVGERARRAVDRVLRAVARRVIDGARRLAGDRVAGQFVQVVVAETARDAVALARDDAVGVRTSGRQEWGRMQTSPESDGQANEAEQHEWGNAVAGLIRLTGPTFTFDGKLLIGGLSLIWRFRPGV
jgi:hypothetical protein